MVRERHDHALSRVMQNRNSTENMPIAYINHFPGWFKIFDLQINPFHFLRTALYFKRELDEYIWVIGIESGHSQRLFVSSHAVSFFCENLSSHGSQIRYSLCCDELLRIEKFLHGFLLQKDHLGRISWCICPYACVSQLTAVLNALLDYIKFFENFSVDRVDGCPHHPFQKCLMRCCTRRILGCKIKKQNLSENLNSISCERISRLFNTCSQYFHCNFFCHELSDIVNHIRDAFSEEVSDNSEYDQRVEKLLYYLIAPIHSPL